MRKRKKQKRSLFEKMESLHWSFKFYFAATFFFVYTLILWLLMYPEDWAETRRNIIPEIVGITIDLILIGIVFTVYSAKKEKEQDIKRWLEEIDDLRGIETEEATRKIHLNIKRLLRQGQKNLDLSGCFLKGANLSGYNLENVVLCETNLEFADLHMANLKGAIIKGTNFKNCYFHGTKLIDVKIIMHSSVAQQVLRDCMEDKTNIDENKYYTWFHDFLLKFGNSDSLLSPTETNNIFLNDKHKYYLNILEKETDFTKANLEYANVDEDFINTLLNCKIKWAEQLDIMYEIKDYNYFNVEKGFYLKLKEPFQKIKDYMLKTRLDEDFEKYFPNGT